MRIIDAFWEKRNLGVEAAEIICNPGDEPATLQKTIESQTASYQVLKIPAGQTGLYAMAHDCGFRFIETQMEITTALDNFFPEKHLVGKLPQMSYAPMDGADKKELASEFAKGIFHTDRISLDPHFSVAIANVRYKNWLDDALARGAVLFKVQFNKNTVGFFALSESEAGAGSAFLCGLYRHKRGQGLGRGIIYFPLLECLHRGLSFHTTYISLNNLPILNLHLQFQGTAGTITQVFIKHLD